MFPLMNKQPSPATQVAFNDRCCPELSRNKDVLGSKGMQVILTEGCQSVTEMLNGYFKEVLLKVSKCISVRSVSSNTQMLGSMSCHGNQRPVRPGSPPFQAASGLSCAGTQSSTKMGHESLILKESKWTDLFSRV